MSRRGGHAAAGSFARDVTKRLVASAVAAVALSAGAYGVAGAVSPSSHPRLADPPAGAVSSPSASVPPSSAATTVPAGSTLPGVPASAAPARPDPSTVSVQVLNGTSTPGAAAYFTDRLKHAGYDTQGAANASAATVAATVVVVTSAGTPADGEAVAQSLSLPSAAVAVGVSSPSPIPSWALAGADVVVVVGADLASQASPADAATTAG